MLMKNWHCRFFEGEEFEGVKRPPCASNPVSQSQADPIKRVFEFILALDIYLVSFRPIGQRVLASVLKLFGKLCYGLKSRWTRARDL